jgi:hypothetical protein
MGWLFQYGNAVYFKKAQLTEVAMTFWNDLKFSLTRFPDNGRQENRGMLADLNEPKRLPILVSFKSN